MFHFSEPEIHHRKFKVILYTHGFVLIFNYYFLIGWESLIVSAKESLVYIFINFFVNFRKWSEGQFDLPSVMLGIQTGKL